MIVRVEFQFYGSRVVLDVDSSRIPVSADSVPTSVDRLGLEAPVGGEERRPVPTRSLRLALGSSRDWLEALGRSPWTPHHQCLRSRGGNGSFPGGMVSESRQRLFRPWIRTSPPPRLRTISLARSIALRCVGKTLLARLCLGPVTAQPSSVRTTYRSLSFGTNSSSSPLAHSYYTPFTIPRQVPVSLTFGRSASAQ